MTNEQFHPLKMNLRKCLNTFESRMIEQKEQYAEAALNKLKELDIKKEDIDATQFSDREKCIYWSGIVEGIRMSSELLTISKEMAKDGRMDNIQ